VVAGLALLLQDELPALGGIGADGGRRGEEKEEDYKGVDHPEILFPEKLYYSTDFYKNTKRPVADNKYALLLQKEHLDLKRTKEVELWTDVLDIYAADLVNAVAEVGTSPEAVLGYILDKGLIGNRLRTPDPKPKPPSGSTK
jgi:hypothetical protein